MKTKIDINTEDWCNLVFEGKNKEYGAFAIRTHAPAMQMKAILITVFFAGAISAIPLLKKHTPPTLVSITEMGPTILDDLTPEPPRMPEPQVVKPKLPSGPTITFTPPVVTNDKDLPESKTIGEIIESKANPGTTTSDGVPGGTLTQEDPTYATPPVNTPRTFVEKMPQLPDLMEYLSKNIRYPAMAKDMGISGRVILQFIVGADGSISDVKLIRGIGGGCDEEAIRVVKLMPRWNPGMQNGEAVPVYFTLPVYFKLANL